MDKMREEFQKLFDEFADKYDNYGDEWQDMSAGDFFVAGCIASRAALVLELPATCCRTLIFEQDNTLEVGTERGEYYDPDDIHAALDKAGIKYE